MTAFRESTTTILADPDLAVDSRNAVIVHSNRRRTDPSYPIRARPAVIAILAADLLLAAQALPHTHPTAPQAVYDVRTAPAHLLTDPVRQRLGPAAMGRFLAMSIVTFDPGDMSDYRRLLLESQPPQLDEKTFADLVIAQKVQEIVAPNLALFWRLPGVDGYDGGVLPLARYNRFWEQFVPPGELVVDGRLREQIRTMPPAALLRLLNVEYVIADKLRDLWFEDVYYDRQIGLRLTPAAPAAEIAVPQPFEATHLDLIGYVDGEPAALAALADENRPVATVTLTGSDGVTETIELTAGGQPGAHFADGALDSPLGVRAGAAVALRDVEGGRQEYRARLPLAAPVTPAAIHLQRVDGPVDLVIQAATLYDERTRMFTALTPSDRGRFELVHGGDVKIYRNLDGLPRAYLAHDVVGVADVEAGRGGAAGRAGGRTGQHGRRRRAAQCGRPAGARRPGRDRRLCPGARGGRDEQRCPGRARVERRLLPRLDGDGGRRCGADLPGEWAVAGGAGAGGRTHGGLLVRADGLAVGAGARGVRIARLRCRAGRGVHLGQISSIRSTLSIWQITFAIPPRRCVPAEELRIDNCQLTIVNS